MKDTWELYLCNSSVNLKLFQNKKGFKKQGQVLLPIPPFLSTAVLLNDDDCWSSSTHSDP